MSFTYLAGMLPAIIFPMATLVQLVGMVRRRSTEGVSAMTWALFGLANIGLYIYAERYTEWQTILGLLLTAILDFAIVGLVFFAYRPVTVDEAG